jgi:hypothetical protein
MAVPCPPRRCRPSGGGSNATWSCRAIRRISVSQGSTGVAGNSWFATREAVRPPSFGLTTRRVARKAIRSISSGVMGGFAPGPPPFTREDGRRYDDRDRDRPRRFTVEQAVQVCQDAVMDRARDRFRGAMIVFGRTAIDDNPGRNDWVVGMLEVQRRRGPSDVYRFSCSVNFDTGMVRSTAIDRDRVRDHAR